MRTFDARFKAKAPPELVEQCREQRPGVIASIRKIDFLKVGHNCWRNEFRADLTDAQVASVLAEGPHSFNPYPTPKEH